MSTRRDVSPRFGGKCAVSLFALTLVAFVAESQLTQYVQTTLHYRQPLFIFYIVHSSFWIIFPLHFAYLIATTNYSASELWRKLTIAITSHLSPHEHLESSSFPSLRFFSLTLGLTVGVTVPALLWFVAISLASVRDVTAIWNTNAFFAYIITVKLFNMKWEPRRLSAVFLATAGVLAVVYGGTTVEGNLSLEASVATPSIKFSAPLVGDLLTLVASVTYGFYQVLYKKYAALPSDPSELIYHEVPREEPAFDSPSETSPDDSTAPVPFGLYANLLTSVIGLLTLAVVWIFIPICHYLNVETFMLPANLTTWFVIAGITLGGVVFNSGLMVLLGLWGPIVTSVGNLLTIVLIFMTDLTFGAGPETLTPWSLVGCSVIVAAFSVLAYDMFSRRS